MKRLAHIKLLALIGVMILVAIGIRHKQVSWQEGAEEERKREIAAEAAARQAAEQRQAAEAERVNREREQVLLEQQQRRRDQESRIENERREREAERQTAQKAVEAHAQFLVQHVNTDFVRPVGKRAVAVVAAREDKTFSGIVNAALASRFKSDTCEMVQSFFKLPYVTDGLLEQSFESSNNLFARLELAKHLDGVLLAREKVRYADGDLVVASIDLEIVLQPLGAQLHLQSWTLSANGAGFNRSQALQVAEEHIAKDIALKPGLSFN